MSEVEKCELKGFRDLKVWQESHQLTLATYRATSSFPRDELYGLRSQTRRCSASISANIAEGGGRRGDAEFGRFVRIATGSASELEYHLILAHDLEYLKTEAYEGLSGGIVEIKRMLASLIEKLRAER